MAANYAFPRGPYGREEIRKLTAAQRSRLRRVAAIVAALAAGFAFLTGGLTWDDWFGRSMLALVVGATLQALPEARSWIAEKEHWGWALPTLELVSVGVVVMILGVIVAEGAVDIRRPLVILPFDTGQLRSAVVVGAGVIFLMGGATHFVRGVLDAVSAKPKRDGNQIDLPEYNRGRVIGNLERILLLAFALTGAYQAMALVVGAKGLVRWTDLKQREFAEYFLIGSLASLLLALCVALVVTAVR